MTHKHKRVFVVSDNTSLIKIFSSFESAEKYLVTNFSAAQPLRAYDKHGFCDYICRSYGHKEPKCEIYWIEEWEVEA